MFIQPDLIIMTTFVIRSLSLCSVGHSNNLVMSYLPFFTENMTIYYSQLHITVNKKCVECVIK